MTLSRTFRLTFPHRVAELGILGCVVFIGVVMGVVISGQHWLLVMALLLLPLVLVWPVQVAIGLFAFVVPFDAIAAAGPGPTGRSVTWFIGAAAIVILLNIGLVSPERLQRPPRSAQL